MGLTIRPYEIQDQNAVLELLRINTPKYFSSTEEADFINYLSIEVEDYFVVLEKDQIIGSGGINYIEGHHVARVSWDMFHPAFQGKGIGSHLLHHRLDRIKLNRTVKRVEVRTSQHTWKFYQKNGFEIINIVNDYWAPNFDLYHMLLRADI